MSADIFGGIHKLLLISVCWGNCDTTSDCVATITYSLVDQATSWVCYL